MFVVVRVTYSHTQIYCDPQVRWARRDVLAAAFWQRRGTQATCDRRRGGARAVRATVRIPVLIKGYVMAKRCPLRLARKMYFPVDTSLDAQPEFAIALEVQYNSMSVPEFTFAHHEFSMENLHYFV